MKTIGADTDALTGVVFAVMGGKFRVRLRNDVDSRWRWGYVLDEEGNIIGCAQDMTYSGSGWCIEVKAYHGYAPLDQVVIVEE
jgi:hypothetical protein